VSPATNRIDAATMPDTERAIALITQSSLSVALLQ
jgi:hypothetical protein